MEYLIIDGELNGTGIRDKYTGDYIDPVSLGLSGNTNDWIAKWLLKYENAHYDEFNDKTIVDELDKEGRKIAMTIKGELMEVKLEYFSAAKMINEDI